MNIDVLLCARGYPAGGSFWYLSSGTGLYRTLGNTIQILLSYATNSIRCMYLVMTRFLTALLGTPFYRTAVLSSTPSYVST